jgi:CheY-like chemotaxis protein
MNDITLLKAQPAWKGINWQRGPRIRRLENLDQIVRAMSGGAASTASIASIVIEEPLDGTAFLNLITTLPTEYLGDVLLIASPVRAFLSSHFEGRERRLYLIENPKTVEEYLDSYGLREGGAVGPRPTGLQRLRVMVAEDERKTREFLVGLLEKAGCEAIVANAGFKAVKVVQERRPQVILLDGLLPEMHGFEVARFVRGMDRDYRPRIILITAVYKHNRYQSEARLKYGVDQYLVKPVTREQIANVVFGELVV